MADELNILPAIESTPISQIWRTYSYRTNIGFYAQANPTYFMFYNRTVRYWSYWYDGWVPGFHDSIAGVFSTGIAHSIVSAVANMVAGQKLIFQKKDNETSDEDVQFAAKWAEESGLQLKYKNLVEYAGALGTSLLKYNVKSGKIWVEALRMDYFFPEIDEMGNVREITMLIKPYYDASDKKQTDNYYIAERRYYEKVKKNKQEQINGIKQWFEEEIEEPRVVYRIYKYSGQSEVETMTDPSGSGSIVGINEIPPAVRKIIMKEYSIIEFGKPQKLPFTDLGVYLFKYENDGARPQSPFGRSISADLLSYYMTYDRTWSWMYRDEYLGKGTVIYPKAMTIKDIQRGIGQGIADKNFTLIPGIDPDKQKPLNFQFNLRVEEWERQLDNIVKRIASTIGINTSAIAPHISSSGHLKTATEIEAEIDLTLSYIENHRSSMVYVFNQAIEAMMNYYNRPGNVKVKFSTPSLVNVDKLIDRALRLLEVGLISPKEALKMIYPDETMAQIEQRAVEAEELLKKKKEEQLALMGGVYEE